MGDGKRAILIVEDDATIRRLLAEMLQAEGYPVAQAEDGAQAACLLENRQPHPEQFCLVLLDMMLPKLDGLGVLQRLASLGSYVPVVAMSANHELLAAAAEAGAQDVVAKPFDITGVLDVVERNCRAA